MVAGKKDHVYSLLSYRVILILLVCCESQCLYFERLNVIVVNQGKVKYFFVLLAHG